MKTPEVDEYGYLKPWDAIRFMLDGGECLILMNDKLLYWKKEAFMRSDGLAIASFAGIKPKPIDPHAKLKAKKEELEAEGKIVKVEATFKDRGRSGFTEENCKEWRKNDGYRLQVYEFSPAKTLAWGYDQEPVEYVVCCTESGFSYKLTGITKQGKEFHFNGEVEKYKYCRLPKDTTLRDEWLVKVGKPITEDDL